MTVEDEEIVMDFTGTDLQVQAALNLPTYNQPGHYFMVLALLFWFRTLDSEIPYNSGLTRPIHMVLPQGSILNPDPGLAYGVRAATSFRVMDMILACLAQAMPDQVPAAPAGAIGISLVAMRDPETGEQRISVAQPLSGGSGGRPGIDGIDGTSFTGGWLRNVPNEMLEADVPVLVERYGYANGTAAPGEFRGGTGLLFRLRNLAPAAVMTARSLERFTFQPWGFRGGKPGTVGRCRLNPGRNDERELGKIDILSLTQDDVVEFRTPGGGGLGDPFRRAPEKVVADVRAGFLDEAAALRDYGVVLHGGKVDTSATELARARHTPAKKLFDGGDQRAAYEAGWPEPMQDALIALLMRHPSAGRAFVRQRVLPVIEAECRAGTPPDRARLEAIFAAAGFRHAA
jgi:N-methylhydantoinase B